MIQAVCAIFALVGLVVYAWDTRQFKMATLAQSEASRRPFFEYLTRWEQWTNGPPPGVKRVEVVSLKNTGVGIALDVTWRPLHYGEVQRRAKPMPRPLDSVSPDGELRIPVGKRELTSEHVQRLGGILITYTDTAGKEYFTMFPLRSDGSVRTVTLAESLNRLARQTNRKYRCGTDTTWLLDEEQ